MKEKINELLEKYKSKGGHNVVAVWEVRQDLFELKQALDLGGDSNNPKTLKEFIKKYIKAFEDGQGSDAQLYKEAKNLL